jgi:RsiW-degrading membrane proteinase PrsW (M82 family)
VLILSLCLYFTLAACGLAIGLIVLRYDLYQREPWYFVLGALFLGAASMWLAGQIEIGIIRAASAQGLNLKNVALAAMAGSTEEFAKFAVVVFFWAVLSRHFNDPLDGLIYGSFAGLGAALEESVFVLSRSHINGYLPPTEPVRLCGHLVMGGIGAFGLGLLTIRSRWTVPVIVLALISAAALHMAWDIAAFSASDRYRVGARLEGWHTAIPIALMLTGMVTYRRLAALGARLTRQKLQICDVRTHACTPD